MELLVTSRQNTKKKRLTRLGFFEAQIHSFRRVKKYEGESPRA